MSADAVTRAEAEDDREFQGLFARHRPGRTLLLVVVVALLAIVAIEGLAPAPRPADFDEPAGWEDIEDALAAAAADSASRVLLFLGDSVLRPAIMKEAGVADAEDFTASAWARRTASADVAIYDLSLDGLLPADMLSIVSRLDSIDPEGRVELAIELSPRYLSKSYATKKNAHARPFLKRAQSDAMLGEVESDLRLIRHRLGMKKARRALAEEISHPESRVLEGARTDDQTVESLRIARHFLDHAESSVQAAALALLADGAARHGRRALFFCTPVSGQALGGSERSPAPVARARRFFRRIFRDRPSALATRSTHQIFRNFDDEAFGEDDFIDHVHLRPEANARLGGRILRSLALSGSEALGPMPQRRSVISAAVGEAKGVFVAADRVLVSRGDEPSALIDLDCGMVDSGPVIPNETAQPEPYRLLFWSRDAEGGLDLMTYSLAEGSEARALPRPEGGWPFDEAPQFDARDDTLLAIAGRTLHQIDWREGRLLATAELPETLGAARPLIGDDRVFLSSSLGDLAFIRSIRVSDLVSGAFDRAEVFASPGEDPRFEQVFLDQDGLRQTPTQREALPFSRCDRIWVDQGSLVIEGPAPAQQDHAGLWRLEVATGSVQALVAPSSDGLIARRDDPERRMADHIVAFDPFTGAALIERDGALSGLDTRLLHRSTWGYGAPPWQENDIVVASGFTHRSRSPESFRVALFGSSLVGACYPDDRPDSTRLRSSLSLTTELGAALDSKLGDSPYRVQALDYSQATADLVRSYATLVHVDPREFHLALIVIDSRSLENPDGRSGPGAQRTAARFDAIKRDETGLPRLELQSGFRPRVSLREIEPEDGADEAASIAACIGEMASLCRARGLRAVFVDLSGLEQTRRDLTGIEKLRRAVRDLGLPLIDGRVLLAPRMDRLPALSYLGDRHFRPLIVKALAEALADRLLPMIESELQLFDRLEQERRMLAAGPTRFAPIVPRGAVLDSAVAARFDVGFERSLLERVDGGIKLIQDLGSAPAEVPHWRRALALFGLRGASGLEAGGKLTIEIIRFADYDEYGRGRGSEAETLARFLIDADRVDEARASLATALEGDSPPDWLQSR